MGAARHREGGREMPSKKQVKKNVRNCVFNPLLYKFWLYYFWNYLEIILRLLGCCSLVLYWSLCRPNIAFARLLYVISRVDGGHQSLATLFGGSWAEKFGNPWSVRSSCVWSVAVLWEPCVSSRKYKQRAFSFVTLIQEAFYSLHSAEAGGEFSQRNYKLDYIKNN